MPVAQWLRPKHTLLFFACLRAGRVSESFVCPWGLHPACELTSSVQDLQVSFLINLKYSS